MHCGIFFKQAMAMEPSAPMESTPGNEAENVGEEHLVVSPSGLADLEKSLELEQQSLHDSEMYFASLVFFIAKCDNCWLQGA